MNSYSSFTKLAYQLVRFENPKAGEHLTLMTKTKRCNYFEIALLALFGITTSLAFSGSTANGSNSRQQCIDCAIVGGGPAGLATAIAISASSPSSSIVVFERDAFQPKGASIQISKSGWKSIAALGDGDKSLTKKLEETAVPVISVEIKSWEEIDEVIVGRRARLRTFLTRKLQKLKSKAINVLASRVITRVHLWHDVRVVLSEHANQKYRGSYNAVDNNGDENGDGSQPLVNLNHSLENIQPLSPLEQQDGARFVLSFKNMVSGEELKTRARHIVACDGIKSKVRSILPNEPDVLLAENKSVWRGLAPNISTSGKATFYRGVSDSNNAGRSGLIFPGGKNVGSSWTIISDVEDQRSNSEEESRRRVLNIVQSMGKDSDNFKLFKQVIDESSIIIESKLHVRDFDKPWESSYDGLIYVGDSAHPVRPTGEGTALAFEDANVLGKVISKFGLCDEALREYENERYEPVKRISEQVKNMAQNFYKSNEGGPVAHVNVEEP